MLVRGMVAGCAGYPCLHGTSACRVRVVFEGLGVVMLIQGAVLLKVALLQMAILLAAALMWLTYITSRLVCSRLCRPFFLGGSFDVLGGIHPVCSPWSSNTQVAGAMPMMHLRALRLAL